MLSKYETSNVYATYDFGRYHVRLWEQVEFDCYMRASVHVGYVLEIAATGETVQIKTTGHYAPEWDESALDKKYRLEAAYAINERYFPGAKRLTVTLLGLAARDWRKQTGREW